MLSPDQGVPLTALGNCICHPAKARRGFLTGLAALGAATALPGCATNSGAASGRYRIDTHHHLFSPAYVSELAKVNQAPPIVRNWSVAKTLEDMEAAGVQTSMLSVTTPHVQFADAPGARRIARESNEWLPSWHSNTKAALAHSPCCPCKTRTAR